jgi:hypothetical protein
MKRCDNTGSLRMPSRLARPTRPIRQCWAVLTLSRLLPPFPAFPGSGCRQLHPTATTAKRRRSLTFIRKQQRLMAHNVLIDSQGLYVLQGTIGASSRTLVASDP